MADIYIAFYNSVDHKHVNMYFTAYSQAIIWDTSARLANYPGPNGPQPKQWHSCYTIPMAS